MSQIQSLLKEMEQEAQTTRKMLQRIPDDKFGWQPHQKSMNIRRLATHIAELPSWVKMALTTNELDFAKTHYNPPELNSAKEIVDYFEKSLAEGKEQLAKASEDQLQELWTLRNGETVYSTSSKGDVIRMSYCQTVHHRAQLGVYLRLLNVPIPGSYGPSADENEFN